MNLRTGCWTMPRRWRGTGRMFRPAMKSRTSSGVIKRAKRIKQAAQGVEVVHCATNGGRVARSMAKGVSRPPRRKVFFSSNIFLAYGLDTAEEHCLLDQRIAFETNGGLDM